MHILTGVIHAAVINVYYASDNHSTHASTLRANVPTCVGIFISTVHLVIYIATTGCRLHVHLHGHNITPTEMGHL